MFYGVCVLLTDVGLRGVTANVIILEEAAFMDQNIFLKIVAPLMGVENTAVLAISTPEDEFNYYSELLNLGLFREVYLGKACQACDDAGLLCIHRKINLPPWKTVPRQNMIEKLYPDKNVFNREAKGIIGGGKDFIFQKRWIRAFMTRNPYQFQYTPTVLHCAIDPAGGAEGSDYAIGTMAYENSMKVVSRYMSVYNPITSLTNTTHRAICKSSHD
jgi:hypothetical protein